MLAYYINLDRRTDRRAFMEAQFAALGLVVERIVATTPETITAEDLSPWSLEDISDKVSPPEAACSISHFRAWRRMLELGHERVLMLEDDLLLSRKLPAFLSAIENEPADIDILRLETQLRTVQIHRRPEPAPRGFAFHRPVGYEQGSGAYVISAACAAGILASPSRFSRPIDDLLFSPKSPYWRGTSIRVAVPALALHLTDNPPDSPIPAGIVTSDTESGRIKRVEAFTPAKLKGLKKLRHEARRVCRQLARAPSTIWTRLNARTVIVPFAG